MINNATQNQVCQFSQELLDFNQKVKKSEVVMSLLGLSNIPKCLKCLFLKMQFQLSTLPKLFCGAKEPTFGRNVIFFRVCTSLLLGFIVFANHNYLKKFRRNILKQSFENLILLFKKVIDFAKKNLLVETQHNKLVQMYVT